MSEREPTPNEIEVVMEHRGEGLAGRAKPIQGEPRERLHGHTPRSAALLAADALAALPALDLPASVAAPIRSKFRALVELCAISDSLLGHPVVYDLELAQAIVDEAETTN